MISFKAGQIFTQNKVLFDSYLTIDKNIIVDISSSRPYNSKIIDLKDSIIIPSLIDTHIHGYNGFDCFDFKNNGLAHVSDSLASCGVGYFVPTLITSSKFDTLNYIQLFNQSLKSSFSSKPLGIFLEGPFISKNYNGIHQKKYIIQPDMDFLKDIVKIAGGNILNMIIAPELNNSLDAIDLLVKNNINASVGHSNADFNQTHQAFLHGACLAVHTFNAMAPLHHRNPNISGYAINNDDMFCELIADCVHTHPIMLKMLAKLKPCDKLILVSDAITGAGKKNGAFLTGDTNIIIKDYHAFDEFGNIAGSTSNLFQNLVNMVNFSFQRKLICVNYASLNPAKFLKLDHKIGSLAKNKMASFNVLDANFSRIKQVYIEGKEVACNN